MPASRRARKLDEVLIVDVDSHHYENECYDEFLMKKLLAAEK